MIAKCPICNHFLIGELAAKIHSCNAKQSLETTVGGPGTELKKIIPKFFSSKECSCGAYATKLDGWGVGGCVNRFDEIVDHLVKQASKTRVIKHFPCLNRFVAQSWLTKAIENAKASAKETQSIDNGEWFVAMTTAPRIDCTLNQSIESMRQAGWEPTIFAEPGSTATDAETVWHESKKGVWHNWLASARYAIENTNASLIMTVQDDSLFHPDSRSFTESILWPHESAGFVSLYTPKHYSIDTAGHLKQTGVNRIKTSSLWGACALVWPRDVLAAAIETPIAKKWVGVRPKSGNPAVMEARRQNPSLVANSDTAIGRMVVSLGKTMWFVDPSPVSHIAIHSTIKHGGNTGRRNCLRCADHSRSLSEQVKPSA